MKPLSKWFYIGLVCLFLQACCLGGHRTTASKGSWEHKDHATYSSVSSDVQCDRCTKITHQRCADEYNEVCETIALGKQVKAINPSTGEDVSTAANNMYAAQCTKLKADPKQIDYYCESHTNDSCMKENGFVYKYHDVSQCSPMKLF